MNIPVRSFADVILGHQFEYRCFLSLYDCLDHLQSKSDYQLNIFSLRRSLFIGITYKAPGEYNLCIDRIRPAFSAIDQLERRKYSGIHGTLKHIDDQQTTVRVDARRPIFHYFLIAIILAFPIAWMLITRIQVFLLFYLIFAVVLAIGIVSEDQHKIKLIQVMLETLPPN